MNLFVANDIGNSETKMNVNKMVFKQPSVIKRVFQTPSVHETDVQKNVSNLLDELWVNINSGAIKRNGDFFIGNRANASADMVENMNIKLGNKYKHDIPVIVTLGTLAGRSVQLAYEDQNELPPSLEVNIFMTSAIPASEYNPKRAKELEDRFLNHQHIIIVNVGDKRVTVTLSFQKVKVTQEGVPALYALVEADQMILNHYHESYPEDQKLNPKDFSNKKILHADIGDGTTEYIYTVGLNANLDACSGERRGVGHATELAVKMLSDELEGYVNYNRQKLMEVIQDPSHPHHELAKQYMHEARYAQAHLILEDLQEKYMTNAASQVDIIAVYGGGSIQFKEELYEGLLNFAEEVKCKVLWIPEEYAVDMNVNGMHVLNNKLLFKKVMG
ncbi:ParM/StbA family protein [Rossellomorea yichunensis]|uniref:ParM/StbA family protein n=1 Tax=Rossellomorea yichunensis TaxID=3077331 RepID=UPI0028DF8E3C|nr:ParM/StbA family protein [Rossellomorea sp. YC4-1]MDT9027802.1 ParM/StbA family protein [Rossellomorea sp. YC4-1]